MLGLGLGISKYKSSKIIEPVLDEYGIPGGAYSLRYIYPTIYSGNVILVRRSSDNAEEGFAPEEILDGTLASFCGVGDGFVKTWYDQSGGGVNLTQNSTSLQPTIVESGVLMQKNNLPAINFKTGAANNKALIYSIGVTNPRHCFIVASYDQALPFSGFDGLITGVTAANGDIGVIGEGAQSRWYDAPNWWDSQRINGVARATAANLSSLITSQFIGAFLANVNLSINGIQVGRDRNSSSRNWKGTIQEFFFFSSDKSSVVGDIESNINNYYSTF